MRKRMPGETLVLTLNLGQWMGPGGYGGDLPRRVTIILVYKIVGELDLDRALCEAFVPAGSDLLEREGRDTGRFSACTRPGFACRLGKGGLTKAAGD